MRTFVRTLCVGVALTLVAMLPTVARATALVSPGNSISGTYFGTGNPNSGWAVDSENGVEIGLAANLRFIGPITPSGSTYTAPTGTSAGDALWDFLFSVDICPNCTTSPPPVLTGYTADLKLQDVGLGTITSTANNVLLIPDNNCVGGSPATVVGSPHAGSCDLTKDWAAQNAENLSFTGVASLLGDPNFNPNLADTYIFTLTLSSPAGSQLAQTSITVNTVPEPSSLALLACGLLGFYGVRRRKA